MSSSSSSPKSPQTHYKKGKPVCTFACVPFRHLHGQCETTWRLPDTENIGNTAKTLRQKLVREHSIHYYHFPFSFVLFLAFFLNLMDHNRYHNRFPPSFFIGNFSFSIYYKTLKCHSGDTEKNTDFPTRYRND